MTMEKRTGTVFLIIALAAFFACLNLTAGDDSGARTEDATYSTMGNSNVGMEFFLTFHPADLTGNTNAFKVYVSSEYEAEVRLTLPNGTVMKKTTVKRDIIEFSLKPSEVLCYSKAPQDKPFERDLFHSWAVRLSADAPVIVYAVAEMTDQSGGYLALPVPVLGTKYVIASSPDNSEYTPGYSSIIAAYDSTDVEISASAETYSIKLGETRQYRTLNKGDIILLAAKNKGEDLSGTLVKSTKPVAVISGNYCTFDAAGTFCDYTIEMETPAYAWGKTYPVNPTPGDTTYMLKIFAGEKGAAVYRDGAKTGYIMDEFGPENVGYITRQLPNEPVVISSDKKINVVRYNIDTTKSTMPFQMNILSSTQFLNEAYFMTPGTRNSGLSDEHYISLAYCGKADGSLPDDLKIAVVEQGTYEWKQSKLSDLSPGPGQKLKDSLFGSDNYYTKSVKIDAGVYKISSDKPVGLYSYGYAGSSAYGFPTTVFLASDIPDAVPPVPSWTLKCDGSVEDGLVTDMPANPDSCSFLQSVIFRGDTSSNYGFSYREFIPGVDRTTKWQLNVINKDIDAFAAIDFLDMRGNKTEIYIHYYAPKLAVAPSEIDFGIVKAGTTVEKEITVTNNHPTSPYVITKTGLKSGLYGFSAVIPESLEIQPKKSVKITVRFLNSATGTFTDSLGIGNDCIFSYRTKLTAQSLRPVIKVTDIDFGDVTIGDKRTKTITVTNSGKVNLVITDTLCNIDKDFTPDFDIQFDQYKPLTITPGNNRKLDISFRPTVEGQYVDTIMFNSDAEGIDSVAVLTGYGVTPGLLVSNINFGNCRVDRLEYTNDDLYHDTVWLKNESATDITIKRIDSLVKSGRNINFIIPKFDEIPYSKLKPNDSLGFAINFYADSVGKYEMEITITDSRDNQKKALITGRGVLPRLTLKDGQAGSNTVDFGEVPVKSATPVVKTVKLYNDPWEYGDTLVVSDFNALNDKESIGTDGRKFGTKGFYIDKNSIGLPKTMQPGETLEFTAEFIAPAAGASNASLKIVSDAENSLVLGFTGLGLEPNLAIESSKIETCVGENDTIRCTVKNTGNMPSTVKSVAVNCNEPVFFPDHEYSFTLEPMESAEVLVVYTPSSQYGPGQNSATLTLNADFNGQERIFTHELAAESFQYSIKSAILPDNNKVLIGDSVLKTLEIQGPGSLSGSKIDEFDVSVSYGGYYLTLKPESISIGDDLDGIFEIKDIAVSEGKATFKIIASTENKYFKGNGEIARMVFHTYTPNSMDSNITIQHTIGMKSECVAFSGHSGSAIELDGGCSNPKLTRVSYTGDKYSMGKLWPNPATGNKVTLQFTLALKGMTEIRIYNSMGRLVAVPLKEVVDHGELKLEIDLSKLNSGVYWYTLTSGAFSATNKMVISR